MSVARSAFSFSTILAASLALTAPVFAQDDEVIVGVSQVDDHVGMMGMPEEMRMQGFSGEQSLIFEPYQMLNEFLRRDDLVYVMRHGPTDWSRRDAFGVASTDCENQRVMTEEGITEMQALGVFLTFFNLRPGEVVVSEWCRNQQTLDALLVGMEAVDAEYAATLPIETDPEVNLLLSLGGAENVTALRERIMAWDGGDGVGPLLIITHFTNIAELTEFNVYEGEILVLDPDRDGRVLGYIRLASSEPDVGHFQGSDLDD